MKRQPFPDYMPVEMVIEALMVAYKWSRAKATREVMKAIREGLPLYDRDRQRLTPDGFFAPQPSEDKQ